VQPVGNERAAIKYREAVVLDAVAVENGMKKWNVTKLLSV
jgi:hypothetical protein